MGRAFREIMSKENIGQTCNNGQLIPVDKPVRFVQAVQGNNPAATALTDEEIVELSKYNEDAVVPGRSEYEHYYRIKFVGDFCLNNRCYAVIRPCLCMLGYEGEDMTITTAKFSVMNSITRLISRLKQDEIRYAVIYRIENDGRIYEMKKVIDLDEVVSFIQTDKRMPPPVDEQTTDMKKLLQEKDEEIKRLQGIVNQMKQLLD